MTLKLRHRKMSVKFGRKLRRIPAVKRLGETIWAGWYRRYRLRNKAKVEGIGNAQIDD